MLFVKLLEKHLITNKKNMKIIDNHVFYSINS